MNILMVATIRDDKDNIVGLRLINTNSGEIVDSRVNDVLKAIASGYKINNIKIHDYKIKGFNGALDRYARISGNTGELLGGKSPLVVVNKIKRKKSGMKVVDFKGVIRDFSDADCVKYATHPGGGIANGKVVGNHISAIEGEYDVIDLTLLDEVESQEKYSGTIYDNRINPLLIYGRQYHTGKVAFKRIDMQSDDRNKETGDNISKILFKRLIGKYHGYDLFNYGGESTLIGEVPIYIDLEDAEDRKEIRDYLKIEGNISKIDKQISSMKKSTKNYKEHRRYVKEYDLVKPISSRPYANLYLTHKGNHGDRAKQRTDEEIEYYLNRLEIMRTNIFKMVLATDKDIVLNRSIYGTGIRYRVLKTSNGGYYRFETTTLEEIYANRAKYQNVKEVDGGIAILGTDYEAIYDMEKIHKTYGREVVSNVEKTKKAEVLGYDLEEQITNDGRLLKYSNNSVRVVDLTGENIKRIGKESIKLHPINKKIIFGEQLQLINKQFVHREDYSATNIDEIEIRCGERAAIGVLNALKSNWTISAKKVEFKRNLTSRELIVIIETMLYTKTGIKAYNMNSAIDDDVLINAFIGLIDKLNKKVDKDGHRKYMIRSINNRLERTWKGGICRYASPQAYRRIEQMIQQFKTDNMVKYGV